MGDKQKHSDYFQLSNDIHNLLVCHNLDNKSLFLEFVVKVGILILLNWINLLHVSFQLESGVLIPFLTGYFRNEPLVVIFVMDIHNEIVFCDGDSWRPPPNDHIGWNNRVSFNAIIHRTETWIIWFTTGFIQPPPNQLLCLPDAVYSSFENASIFPLQSLACMNNIFE